MVNLESIQTFLTYNDWANEQLLQASEPLDWALLDRAFEMGRGTLRKTLLHIAVAEYVWVQRWKGRTETPWPNEEEPVGIADMRDRLAATQSDRTAFLATLGDADLRKSVLYRDSFGSLYTAALGDMLIQLCTHSAHHRAQAVNMLRRLGAATVELDYMYWIRQPDGR